jgi:sodium transport system permease protein
MQQPEDTAHFIRQVVVMQLVVIATPALLMTIMLTRSAAQTLLLKKPAWWTIPGAALLAVALHPMIILAGVALEQLYPISPVVKEQLKKTLDFAPNLGLFIVMMAILPAICEELAFRGFILSGLRHLGRKWRAIVLSALIFGITHTIFQQSLITFFVGIIIAFIAVQTGSIVPGMVFHFTHNALLLTITHIAADKEMKPYLDPFVLQLSPVTEEFIYRWWVFVLGILIAGGLILKFARLSYRKTEEESLQEAIEQQTISAA